MDYWLSHALISPETHDELSKACNYSDPNCCSQQCNDIYYYASQVEIGGIDFYSIDTPACTVNANGTPLRRRLYQTSQANKMKRTNPVRGQRCSLSQYASSIVDIQREVSYDVDWYCFFQRRDECALLPVKMSNVLEN